MNRKRLTDYLPRIVQLIFAKQRERALPYLSIIDGLLRTAAKQAFTELHNFLCDTCHPEVARHYLQSVGFDRLPSDEVTLLKLLDRHMSYIKLRGTTEGTLLLAEILCEERPTVETIDLHEKGVFVGRFLQSQRLLPHKTTYRAMKIRFKRQLTTSQFTLLRHYIERDQPANVRLFIAYPNRTEVVKNGIRVKQRLLGQRLWRQALT